MYKFLVIFSAILITVQCAPNSQILISKHQDGKIVGGSAVNIIDYSYIVSVRFKSYWSGEFIAWCGGCIYNETVIITAAHCLYGIDSTNFKVRAGSQYHYKGGQLIDVDRTIIHEYYNRRTLNNDIALMFLKNPLKFSNTVSPINLPNSETNITVGTIATVSGWGHTKESSGIVPDKLQAVQIEIMDKKSCEKYYGIIDDEMLCAGVVEGGKDSCQGDSGGPLVVNKTLAGIVSWGYGCARKDYPGVYSNVLKLFKWIYENL